MGSVLYLVTPPEMALALRLHLHKLRSSYIEATMPSLLHSPDPFSSVDRSCSSGKCDGRSYHLNTFHLSSSCAASFGALNVILFYRLHRLSILSSYCFIYTRIVCYLELSQCRSCLSFCRRPHHPDLRIVSPFSLQKCSFESLNNPAWSKRTQQFALSVLTSIVS